MLPEIRQERRTRYAVVFGSSDKRKPALLEDVGMYGEKRNSEFADMCRARRLSTFRPILSAPERRYLSTAVFLSGTPALTRWSWSRPILCGDGPWRRKQRGPAVLIYRK